MTSVKSGGWAEVGGEIVDADQAHVVHRLHPRRAELVAGVVSLHVADHRRHAGPLDRGDDAVGLGQREAERFLDEEVLARLGRRDRHLGVLHRQHRDRVDVVPVTRLGVIREANGHAVPLADRLDDRRRQIADRRRPETAAAPSDTASA